MAKRSRWTRDQLLIVLRLYCDQPYGRLHLRNPEIHRTAELIDRTPSAVVFKACNLASLDPTHQERGVKGLTNTSNADEELWNEFMTDSEAVAAEAEEVYERTMRSMEDAPSTPDGVDEPNIGDTERETTVRVRRVQGFFRRVVLTSYAHRCAISGVPIPALLNASHIIPWSEAPDRRADPHNGIALNALYDRAFDRGLISISADHRVMVSLELCVTDPADWHRRTLVDIAGARIELPSRFRPAQDALAYHRESVFIP